MSVLSRPYFHCEAAAFEHVESALWPNGPHCPHCGNAGKIYELKGVRSKPSKKNPEGVERHGLKKCGECRKQFTVRIGTIFEESHIPLHKWLQAIYLMCSSKKGISSNQLARVLEITVKSAWFLSHRIREAMRAGDLPPMGGDGKTVEADETFVGGKEKNRHKSKRFKTHAGGTWGKEIVFSLVERKGHVRSVHTPSVTAATLRSILVEQLEGSTKLMTDDAGQYRHMQKDFDHEVVNHRANEYVRGEAHTNTVEGYFSILKRGIIGTYHHVSPQHLKRYLAEFDFRYNNRIKLGVTDLQRSENALRGIVGKRLFYREQV
ncbi:IS1595 family transposase [Roseibium sp. MB-4]